MANKEDIKNLKEAQERLQQLNAEYRKLTGKKLFTVPTQDLGEANEQIKAFELTVQSTKREAAGLSNVFSDLYSQLKANVGELDKASNSINTGKRAYRELVKNVRELGDEEAGIGKVSFANLKKIQQRSASAVKEMKLAAQRLKIDKDITKLSGEKFNALEDSEKALLRAQKEGFEAEEKAVRFSQTRLDLERQVLDSVKLTGGALKGIGNLAGSLGLTGFAESISEIQDDLDNTLRKKIREAAQEQYGNKEGNEEYREKLKLVSELKSKTEELTKEELVELKIAEDIVQNHEEGVQALYDQQSAVVGTTAKFKALLKASGEFVKQLRDPLVTIGAMVKGFLAIDEAATSLQRTTGQNAMALSGLNTALATNAEVMELMASFAEQTNRNLSDLVPNQELGKIRALSDMLGLSAQEAGTLALNTQLSGTNAEEFTSQAFAAAKDVALASGSAINLGTAVQEASKASGALALNLGNNPKEIARATAEAQRLGLNLQQMEGIATGMLDFESSIQNELEAQLLTGKKINLSKAREFALRGDLAGLAEEIGKQEGVMEAFSSKNLIAQEAAAKAVGMTRNELAKSIALKALDGKLSVEAAARMSDMTEDQILQLSVQQKINKAIGKLQQSLAPLLEGLVPFVDVLAAGVQILGKMISMFTSIGVSVGEAGNGVSKMNGGLDKASETMEELSLATKTLGGVLVGGLLLGGFRKVYKIVKSLGKGISSIIKGIKSMSPALKKVAPEIVEKGAKSTVAKTATKLSAKQIASGFGGKAAKDKLLKETAEKTAQKGGAKGVTKLLGKNLGKTILKKIPGIGLLAGIGFGLQRAMEGDYAGAAMELSSGALSTIPGFGTAGSLAVDAALIARDLNNQSKIESLENPDAEQGGSKEVKVNDFTLRANPKDTLVMAGGTKFGEETNALLKQLISEVSNIKGDVYIDGYKAGQSIFAASNNLPS